MSAAVRLALRIDPAPDGSLVVCLGGVAIGLGTWSDHLGQWTVRLRPSGLRSLGISPERQGGVITAPDPAALRRRLRRRFDPPAGAEAGP